LRLAGALDCLRPLVVLAGERRHPVAELVRAHHERSLRLAGECAPSAGALRVAWSWPIRLTESTVRSHLHNTYAKPEVPDRAQAVLKATEMGRL
jgi:hypothetical protein